MRYKVVFLAGFTTGYVLGTKAGRRRYEQITSAVRRTLHRPEVERLTETAKRAVTQKFAGQDVTDEVSPNGVGASIRI